MKADGNLVLFQKISKSGKSRVLAVTRLLPPDWKNVRITRLQRGDAGIVLVIQKVE